MADLNITEHELVALDAAIASNCVPCAESHIGEARRLGLTDSQIADIELTAHDIDIARGKLALSKTKNDEVKQFAQQMVDDHGVVRRGVAAVQQVARTRGDGLTRRAAARRHVQRVHKHTGDACHVGPDFEARPRRGARPASRRPAPS